jgi:hypothetical protein
MENTRNSCVVLCCVCVYVCMYMGVCLCMYVCMYLYIYVCTKSSFLLLRLYVNYTLVYVPVFIYNSMASVRERTVFIYTSKIFPSS